MKEQPITSNDKKQSTPRIRRIGGWIYGVYAWIVFCTVLLVLGSVIIVLRKPRYARPLAHYTARLIFFLARMPISVHGLERLPNRPHILLVNHTSFLDAIALTALLPPRPGYMFTTRQQYRSQALLWPLLKALGTTVFAHAGPQHHTSNLALLAKALKHGDNPVVFPEGAVSPNTGLQPFHTGAFVVAATEKSPVVIAGLHGAREALHLGTWMPRRSPIHLEIGSVLWPDTTDADALREFSDAAREAMQPLTGEK